MILSPLQKHAFDQFGFLHFPGLLNDSIGWMTNEFESVWASRQDIVHTGEKRTMFPGAFICQSPRLCTLLDDPRIHGICEGLMGPDYQYAGGDGNFYSGDTGWHSDTMPGVGMYRHCLHIKIAFYLDPVTRDTGALRVIPGSHIPGDHFSDQLGGFLRESGIAGKDVPAAVLETQPGDVLAFTHNIKHASFGGGNRRRMFVMNMMAWPHTPEAYAEAHAEWLHYASVGCEKLHSEIMMQTASPQRLQHLAPMIDLFAPILQEFRAASKTSPMPR